MPKPKSGPSTTESAKARKVLKEVQPRELWIKPSDKIFDSSSEDEELSPQGEQVVQVVEQEIVVDDEGEEEVVRAKASRSRSRSASVPAEQDPTMSENDQGAGAKRDAIESSKLPAITRERKVIDYAEPIVTSPPRVSNSSKVLASASQAKDDRSVVESLSMGIVVEETGTYKRYRWRAATDARCC